MVQKSENIYAMAGIRDSQHIFTWQTEHFALDFIFVIFMKRNETQNERLFCPQAQSEVLITVSDIQHMFQAIENNS